MHSISAEKLFYHAEKLSGVWGWFIYQLFKGYIFCFHVHSDGWCIFELSAHETNLMKKCSVYYEPGPAEGGRQGTLKTCFSLFWQFHVLFYKTDQKIGHFWQKSSWFWQNSFYFWSFYSKVLAKIWARNWNLPMAFWVTSKITAYPQHFFCPSLHCPQKAIVRFHFLAQF